MLEKHNDDLSLGWELFPHLDLDRQKRFGFLIEPNKKVHFSFKFNDKPECAIIIYRINKGPLSISGPVVVRGNFGRSQEPFEISTFEEGESVQYYVTSWHKNKFVNDPIWVQSWMRNFMNGDLYICGFEAYTNWTFNNARFEAFYTK
ncbi:hypothetical protein [Bacillus cereus]|uniref:hypothetical protein n=1 Tax=Bacillus cereus TaxID=1396 RepID=UPI000BF86B46|nr:hypothetical protein [Bacillus cereus]PFD09189.1 hypothetical protein CN295_22930 [Bacillus cereus]HDX9649073.1 hypothetical protein [Bacillus cereus]